MIHSARTVFLITTGLIFSHNQPFFLKICVLIKIDVWKEIKVNNVRNKIIIVKQTDIIQLFLYSYGRI